MIIRAWLVWLWTVLVTGVLSVSIGHYEPIIGALLVAPLALVPFTALCWWDER